MKHSKSKSTTIETLRRGIKLLFRELQLDVDVKIKDLALTKRELEVDRDARKRLEPTIPVMEKSLKQIKANEELVSKLGAKQGLLRSGKQQSEQEKLMRSTESHTRQENC